MSTEIPEWLDYAKRIIDAGPQGGEYLLEVRGLARQIDPAGLFYTYLYRVDPAMDPAIAAFDASGPHQPDERDPLPWLRALSDGRRLVVRATVCPPAQMAALGLVPVLHRTCGQFLVDVADAHGLPLELSSLDGARIFALRWHRHEATFYERGVGARMHVKGPPHVLAAQAWYRGFQLYTPGAVEALLGQTRGQA